MNLKTPHYLIVSDDINLREGWEEGHHPHGTALGALCHISSLENECTYREILSAVLCLKLSQVVPGPRSPLCCTSQTAGRFGCFGWDLSQLPRTVQTPTHNGTWEEPVEGEPPLCLSSCKGWTQGMRVDCPGCRQSWEAPFSSPFNFPFHPRPNNSPSRAACNFLHMCSVVPKSLLKGGCIRPNATWLAL